MFKRLLQAATITFVLNLIAHMNPTTTQPSAVSPALEVPQKILIGLR
ncbi:MAG: hypothetical protein KME25_27175 [Symplocastrum torsivum CPER-KK1]|jgi:hypothetical protein|uniref:Uncharacterized protein n=1 Tax=Symplocastrum torsivum CPER-KK1 TaxID=450513 RepID=A0A951PQL0_9CYAN|nr:hypothetical protein [Symplocastrum torsivum CPER-KK1]